ncbi:MAG: hypothetical protein R2710_10835 [Acidimicrobiales bacterium]
MTSMPSAPVVAELGTVDRNADGSEVGNVFGACIQLEAEAAQLDPEDRAEMLDALGLGEGALPRFIQAAYHVLGLRTFLTTGPMETRAWTYRGVRPHRVQGKIHRSPARLHPLRDHPLG